MLPRMRRRRAELPRGPSAPLTIALGVVLLACRAESAPVVQLYSAGQGSDQDYGEVLRLGALPNIYMKFSGVRYSSKESFPYRDAMDTVKRAFDAFTPDRMIWGGLGHSMPEFENAVMQAIVK